MKPLQTVDSGKAFLGIVEGEKLPLHGAQSPAVELSRTDSGCGGRLAESVRATRRL